MPDSLPPLPPAPILEAREEFERLRASAATQPGLWPAVQAAGLALVSECLVALGATLARHDELLEALGRSLTPRPEPLAPAPGKRRGPA